MSNNKDLMGYDPLEWLREENHDIPVEAMPPTHTDDSNSLSVDDQPCSEVVEKAPAQPTSGTIINFGSSLQIMDVALLKQRLVVSLHAGQSITLRADEEIIVDGAGMQLLLAFVRQADADGVALSWEKLPAPINNAASLLNCEQVLLIR